MLYIIGKWSKILNALITRTNVSSVNNMACDDHYYGTPIRWKQHTGVHDGKPTNNVVLATTSTSHEIHHLNYYVK